MLEPLRALRMLRTLRVVLRPERTDSGVMLRKPARHVDRGLDISKLGASKRGVRGVFRDRGVPTGVDRPRDCDSRRPLSVLRGRQEV